MNIGGQNDVSQMITGFKIFKDVRKVLHPTCFLVR